MKMNQTKSRLFATLLLSFIMLFSIATSAFAMQTETIDNKIGTVNKIDSSGAKYLYDPETNQYLPIHHVESQMATMTQNTKRDYTFERMFEKKRAAAAQNAKQNNRKVKTTPVPGGVGYGAYFNSEFQSDFTTGTTLYYNIICPEKPGGDVNNYLYLTSSNRAAKGVEAFISYYRQNSFNFKVFDWARPESDHWQITLPYSDLSNYITTKTIHNTTYPCITIQNRTVETSSTTWQNIVWLKNYNTNTYDQVYNYTYSATLNDQRDSHYGSWGPIVETFQTSYGDDTNALGFYNINLMSKTTPYSNTSWNNWELLTDDVSYIRNDNLGFHVLFRDPNYSFVVH